MIVPLRGMLKAKLSDVPGAPVRSIVEPTTDGVEAEFPKPSNAPVPANPPAMVVILMQKWFVKGLVDTEK